MWMSDEFPKRRSTFPDAAWLFPELGPYEPPGSSWSDRAAYLEELAGSLVETATESGEPELDHPTMPSAYGFLAEFVEHEISMGALPWAEPDPPMRAPRLDLTSVYGAGPEQSYLYDRANASRLLLEMPHGPDGDLDLPRNGQGCALLGEPRNDGNLVTGQLHLALLRFHNAVLEWVLERHDVDEAEAFSRARRLVCWHFQWVVLHDLLPRLVGRELVDAVLGAVGGPAVPRLSIYGDRRSVVPLEFVLGAFLARISLQRVQYDVNDRVRARRVVEPAGSAGPVRDLRGGRPLPKGWTVQWNRFVEVGGASPQLCRRINTQLPAWTHQASGSTDGSYLSRALRLAWRCGLPSGQDVARAMGLPPVRAGSDPLLVYVLSEAEDPPNDGTRLVGVGARIVAEVLVGAVASDRESFLRREPAWKPVFASSGEHFDLADLLRFAGAPMSATDLAPRGAAVVPVRRTLGSAGTSVSVAVGRVG